VKYLLEEEVVVKLNDRHQDGFDSYFVGVDIGATNSRIAISFRSQGVLSTPLNLFKFLSSSKTQLLDGLFQIAEQVTSCLKKDSSGGCIAAAGRILDAGSRVDITNYEGPDREINKFDLPASFFPVRTTHFINDLESASYGILALHDQKNCTTSSGHCGVMTTIQTSIFIIDHTW